MGGLAATLLFGLANQEKKGAKRRTQDLILVLVERSVEDQG